MEVFVLLLSDVRRKTERSIEFYRELTKLAEEPEVKQPSNQEASLQRRLSTRSIRHSNL